MSKFMTLQNLVRLSAALMLSVTLAACGGGGGDDDATSNPTPPDTSTPEPAKPELRCAP